MPDFFGVIGNVGQQAALATSRINWGQTLLTAGVNIGTAAASALIARQLAPKAPKATIVLPQSSASIPPSTAANMDPALAAAQRQGVNDQRPGTNDQGQMLMVYGSIFLLAAVVLLRK